MAFTAFVAMSGAASRGLGARHWKHVHNMPGMIDEAVVDLDRFCSEGGGKSRNLS